MVSQTEVNERTGKRHRNIDEYVEILRDIGGEAPTNEFAEAADRDHTTVNRRFEGVNEDDDTPVERVDVGGAFLYRITDGEDADSARDEDEAQEGSE